MAKQTVQEYLGPFLLALLVGTIAGFGAVVFRSMIFWGQHILWPAGANFTAQVEQASWWWIIAVPTVMGLLAGPVVTFWAPEVRGPGVPEVMEALALRGGTIRHRVTVIKALVTAALISAGGSLGREGPVVQIGSSIGSSLSQLFRLGPDAKRMAVACGAAAGIGATFQAPMAGTLFAVEVLLHDLEVKSLSNIIIAAVAGTMTARMFIGDMPMFIVPRFTLQNPQELLLYFALGIAAGFLGLILMSVFFLLPRLWKVARLPDWLTPAAGGLLLGLIGLFSPWALGVGYESINIALVGKMTFFFALLLLVSKVLATSICIGSGMSGGIFAPSLFLGAMLGHLTGLGAQHFLPGAGIDPANCALIGMGAMVSATTLAPITAIFTIFELTYSYQVILPLMVSSIAGMLVVRLLHGYSIYETKLLHKGINIVKGHEVNILRGLLVKDHMDRHVGFLPAHMPCEEIMLNMEQSHFPHFVVLDERQKLAGVLTLRDFRRIFAHRELCRPDTTAATLMNRDVVTVGEESTMDQAFHAFARHHFSFLPVVSAHDPLTVVGQIKKTDLLSVYDQFIFKEHVLSPLGWVCPLPQKNQEAAPAAPPDRKDFPAGKSDREGDE